MTRYKAFRGVDGKIHYIKIEPITGSLRGMKADDGRFKSQQCDKCGGSYMIECYTCYANVVTEVTREEIERIITGCDKELEDAINLVNVLNEKFNADLQPIVKFAFTDEMDKKNFITK